MNDSGRGQRFKRFKVSFWDSRNFVAPFPYKRLVAADVLQALFTSCIRSESAVDRKSAPPNIGGNIISANSGNGALHTRESEHGDHTETHKQPMFEQAPR
jgi:hypothetical protein